MSDAFVPFLRELFANGRALLSPEPPHITSEAIEILRAAYSVRQLSIAGPPIAIHEQTAVAAALLVYSMCQCLADRSERADALKARLQMPFTPSLSEHHLSADLTFQFLPQVLRRARAIEPEDPLIVLLENLLREWPLSGVLTDIEDAPKSNSFTFDHPGLCLLYAERLAHHDRPSWYPEGVANEYWELVRSGSTST